MGGFGWAGVAVAVALTATTTACTSHHNGTAPKAAAASSLSPSPTPSARLLQIRASKSFSFVAGVGQAAASDAANLVVAKRINDQQGGAFLREVTLVIARPSFAATCVVRADLRLHSVAVTGAPADVGVFPSAALAFAQGQAPEVPSQLLDNQPAGHATVSSRQPLSIDVTELVRAWLRGVFPSRGATVPRSAPLLLTVQPPDLTSGRYAITFAGVRRPQGPMLVVQDRC